MRGAGYRFRIRPGRVVEGPRPGEAARRCARRLAAAKALAAARALRAGRVLGADTLVAVEGTLLGKPTGPGDAGRMLRLLSGRTHRVVTGVAVCGPGGGALRVGSASTLVTFRCLTRREIRDYVDTGEPMDKAGAYAIQGGAGRFVIGLRGSYTNVVGLPLELVRRLLGPPA